MHRWDYKEEKEGKNDVIIISKTNICVYKYVRLSKVLQRYKAIEKGIRLTPQRVLLWGLTSGGATTDRLAPGFHAMV